MKDRLSGSLIFINSILIVIVEWGGGSAFAIAAGTTITLFLAVTFANVSWPRRAFIIIGLALFALALATRPDWQAMTFQALKTAAFVGAFFVALTWLRNAAASSPAIRSCGLFLAEQPPGRRYLALTIGGHIFAVILNYGALSLLGNLATSSAASEPDLEARQIRTRRMLLAVQRGFVAMLSWSPLAFSIAITTTIIPGASWGAAVVPCLGTALIVTILGWALDTAYKPNPARVSRPRKTPEGNWWLMSPLVLLLIILVISVGLILMLTPLRAVAAVMVFMPVLSLSWIALQELEHGRGVGERTAARFVSYVTKDLPSYRAELVILIMAGFIGTMGSSLLAPLVVASGIDLATLPAWVVLVALVWLIPLTGQLGMNPILSISLFAPLLPDPSALGVSPAAFVVAITGGWTLAGASSPYTASTMLIGSLGGVSARRVGTVWNGAFTLVGAGLVSLWVIAAIRWF